MRYDIYVIKIICMYNDDYLLDVEFMVISHCVADGTPKEYPRPTII